jgi:PAS domain S-box-containing protein
MKIPKNNFQNQEEDDPELKSELREMELRISNLENKLTEQAGRFQILNRYSIDLNNKTGEEIYEFIVIQFKEIFEAKEVWISVYDEKTSDLVLRATTLSETDNSKAVKTLGQKILGFRSPVSKDMYLKMIQIKITEPSSLHEISFGQISNLVSSAIARLFSIGWFQAITLTYSGRLYGGLLIAGNDKQSPPDREELKIFTEITSSVLLRKMVENELAASVLRFRELSDMLPQLIFETDTGGHLTFINQFGLDMLGYSGEELQSLDSVFNMVHIDDRKFVEEAFRNTLAGSGPVPREFRIFRKDGNQIPIMLHTVLFSENNMPKGIRGTGVDISEIKKSQSEIQSKNDQLQKILAAKDKFFSIIAHDLRSPFNYFLGITQLITEEIDSMSSGNIREHTLNMRNSARNLYSLLENLLEWSKMERGIVEFNPVRCHLEEKIRMCVELISEPARKKGQTISYLFKEDLYAFADLHMLEAIVRNLVSNSIKFTPRGGHILISATKSQDDFVEIKIYDTGIGMHKEMVKELFKLNEKVHRKGTDGEPSTGLGLLLCKEFVEKHGGEMHVESEPGKGSCFSFTMKMA